jgi:NADH dehydrogenase
MDVVTGAFSFTGRYVAARLLELSREVRTLTRHPQTASPFGARVEAFPLDFDLDTLTERLRGADTLYNTYWIRSPRGTVTFERVLDDTVTLLSAARKAGVRRVVQLSVSNASASSTLPYSARRLSQRKRSPYPGFPTRSSARRSSSLGKMCS